MSEKENLLYYTINRHLSKYPELKKMAKMQALSEGISLEQFLVREYADFDFEKMKDETLVSYFKKKLRKK